MRRLGTLLNLGLAAAAITAVGIGCNGPISDWPPKAGDGVGSAPGAGSIGGGAAGGLAGGGPVVVNDAGAPAPVGGGQIPGAPGGVAGGSALGGLTGGGGSLPTGSADAGVYPSQDASAPQDTGGDFEPGDGGLGQPDAGDGSCNVVPDDAGVVPAGDAGFCPAYGCGMTLTGLSAAGRAGGACVTPDALPSVCSGALSRAALECTQENALGLGLGRPVSMCMRRLPQFARVPGDCLQCYADETLCTLSRCIVACIDGSDPACQQCRQQSCAAAFSECSGVPASVRMLP